MKLFLCGAITDFELKGATTPEAVSSLQVAKQNPSSFKGKLRLIVPPLVLTTILEANTIDPTKLIPILLAKFQDFDRYCATVKAYAQRDVQFWSTYGHFTKISSNQL